MEEIKGVKENIVFSLCKLFKFIFKLEFIFLIFALVCVVITGILIPIIGTNIKIKDNKIEVFKQEILYRADVENNDLIVTYEGNEYSLVKETNADIPITINSTKLVKMINNFSIKRLVVVGELLIVASVIVLIASCYIVNSIYKILRYIVQKETIFDYENVSILKNISKIICIEFVLIIICSLFITVISKDFNCINISSHSLVYAAFAYVLAWIVEKGTTLNEIKQPRKNSSF